MNGVQLRTVRNGAVKIEGALYRHSMLSEWEGRRVFVKECNYWGTKVWVGLDRAFRNSVTARMEKETRPND